MYAVLTRTFIDGNCVGEGISVDTYETHQEAMDVAKERTFSFEKGASVISYVVDPRTICVERSNYGTHT